MQSREFEQALSDLPLGPVRFFERVGSTNDEAGRWVEAGAPDLALICADEQTAGRGRQDRRWLTPPGTAIAFSLVLRPDPLSHLAGPPDSTGQDIILPYIAHHTALGALGVAEALREKYGLAPEIKWPNDVLLGRQKVAGVLAEAHWRGDQLLAVVLGVGVNVSPGAVPPSEALLYPATCVETHTAGPVDRLSLLHAILKALLAWRPLLGSVRFLQAWEDLLAFRGEWVSLAGGAAPPEGLVLGLEANGALRVKGRGGENFQILSGEISLRPVDRP
jgi:BirA family biotin operon repressor/biotin-[acetyl-CoA-carboxylase] ligase